MAPVSEASGTAPAQFNTTGGGQNQSASADGLLTFEADLRKLPGSRLGIDVVLVSSPHGCGLVVERVNEGGVVEAWNRRSRDPMKIRAGDFIVRVNGIEGEISALASELRTGSDVCITVQRAAQDDAPQTWKDLQASIMRSRPGPGQQPPGPGSQSGASAAQYNEPIVPGNSSSGYPGPVGLPDQQSNPRPKAPGLTAWGAPGYQPVGMPNFRQGLEHSQTQWQGKGWPGSQWALPDSLVDAGPPPVVGAGEQGNKEGVEALSENAFSFEVSLIKPERARLGIDVMPHTVSQVADFCGLTVKRVSKGGVVDEWNQQCRDPRAQVCPGDRIVRVNGVSSDFAQMWEMLCTQRELHVTVRRSNSMPSFSHGHQGFGVGPVQLPGRGVPMLDNRPALTNDRGVGPQAGKSPPAISLPNQSASIASISRGTGPSNSGNVSYGLGKGGTAQEVPFAPAMPTPFQHNTMMGGASAANVGGAEGIRFDVTLENSKSKRVGMDVIMVSGSQLCGFVVERVMEGGRVDVWNKKSQPPYTVQTGDYIVQVNGVGNWQSLSKMAEEFVKEGQQVSFTIQRGTGSNNLPAPVAQSAKSSRRPEADTRSPAKATNPNFDTGEGRGRHGSEQIPPEFSPPLPMGFSNMSPPPPPPQGHSGKYGGLRQALAVSAPPTHEALKESPVGTPVAKHSEPPGLPPPAPPGLSFPLPDLAHGFAGQKIPPPPPPLPVAAKLHPGHDGRSIGADKVPTSLHDKDMKKTNTTAEEGEPRPTPPPAKGILAKAMPAPKVGPNGGSAVKGKTDDSKDEQGKELKSEESIVNIDANGIVTPIRIGAVDTKVPPGLALLEEAMALEEEETNVAVENPTTLLASSLQLQDEDLAALLSTVLTIKPHLRGTVSKALMLGGPDSVEDGRLPQDTQALGDSAIPTS